MQTHKRERGNVKSVPSVPSFSAYACVFRRNAEVVFAQGATGQKTRRSRARTPEQWRGGCRPRQAGYRYVPLSLGSDAGSKKGNRLRGTPDKRAYGDP